MTIDLQTSEPASQHTALGRDTGLIAVAAKETFEGTWPFQARFSSASGYPMHYVDEGSGPETLLLLHGEPTWSDLYRAQIAEWSRDARVLALDHMGFGKSATPQDRSYWLQDHIDNTERFVLEQDLRDVTLVMHDFGGPVGMGLAIRHPDRIKRIVSVNGPTPLGQPDLLDRLIANAGAAPWFQWIMQAEEKGTLEEVLGHLDYNILSTLKLNGFVRNELINDTWLNAYRAPFPAPEFAAGAIGWAKGFATRKHAFEEPSDAVKSELAKKPAIAIWGEADRTLQAEQFLPLFQQAFPDGQVRTLPGTGHYSPEDAPQLISGLVSEFIAAS
ncbi:alpha/beta fold hydrolase [Leisingera sp. JC11]|uniref:alpha/beta fold hydrolase n=1 Tax=Leisingera sp. JC11 TaxID=3042469 RepID=UPI003452EDAF